MWGSETSSGREKRRVRIIVKNRSYRIVINRNNVELTSEVRIGKELK